jgi:hypothetical protein
MGQGQRPQEEDCTVGCNPPCNLLHATATCPSGTCQIASCEAGWGDCDGNPASGCETRLDTPEHCGSCPHHCTNAHGNAACGAAGVCAPACSAGYGDCDTNKDNGCETQLNTLTNCGMCGLACDLAGAAESCTTGTCTLGACDATHGNCDGMSANGCETPTTTTTNCGACGTACANDHGTTACTGGSCVPACASGFGNCDGNANNGCETALNTATNCGMCGVPCGAGSSCATGSCVVSMCAAGTDQCDGNPANGCEPLSTVQNCGACGNACTNANGSTSCNGTACVPSCAAGFQDCDGNPRNGCETPLNSNTNCAGCNQSCARTNADATCATGSCAIASCNYGYATCDGNDANGCEKQLSGYTNSSPGENLGSYPADAFSGWPSCGGQGCNQVLTRTGTQGRYFNMRALEDSACSSWLDLRFVLSVPSGVDYDLYVSGGCHCLPADCRSIALSGQTDTVDVWCDDDGAGGDDSFTANVEVRYLSGNACAAWTLTAYRQQCE